MLTHVHRRPHQDRITPGRDRIPRLLDVRNTGLVPMRLDHIPDELGDPGRLALGGPVRDIDAGHHRPPGGVRSGRG
jgi:hypothetical protein